MHEYIVAIIIILCSKGHEKVGGGRRKVFAGVSSTFAEGVVRARPHNMGLAH